MVWSWNTFFTWVDIWIAVGTFSWRWNWFGHTVSKSLSFWKIWAMFKADIIMGSSWSSLDESILIGAVEPCVWISDSSGSSVH